MEGVHGVRLVRLSQRMRLGVLSVLSVLSHMFAYYCPSLKYQMLLLCQQLGLPVTFLV
jgi:hypothetical protein